MDNVVRLWYITYTELYLYQFFGNFRDVSAHYIAYDVSNNESCWALPVCRWLWFRALLLNPSPTGPDNKCQVRVSYTVLSNLQEPFQPENIPCVSMPSLCCTDNVTCPGTSPVPVTCFAGTSWYQTLYQSVPEPVPWSVPIGTRVCTSYLISTSNLVGTRAFTSNLGSTKLQTEAGTSSSSGDGEAAGVVRRAEVEEPPRPEPRPRRKRPEEPGTSTAAAEPGAAAPADADKEGVYTTVVKKRKLKKRTSPDAADLAAGEEESVWGPITVSHDSGVWSQPSAVVEPSAGSEGQEKGGPQPADLVSEDPVLEGSDVGGDSLGAQAGPVDVPPSDETPQPAGSVAEMPAADGDSAGEEENGSDEDGWEDGLSDTSQLSDITASQRGKLYSLTEISDFLEKTKGNRL
ncbi:UNVERIFIED_CONTAM: hypothetical protein FKN15_063729 [Acipenser sinensis]